MRSHRLAIVGISSAMGFVPAEAYAQGSERALANGLDHGAAIVAVVFTFVVTAVWIATAHQRVRAWLALTFTVVALGSIGAMAWAWAWEVWQVWAAIGWCVAASVAGTCATSRRRRSASALPTATARRH